MHPNTGQRGFRLAVGSKCITVESCGALKLVKPRFKRRVQTQWGIKERTFVVAKVLGLGYLNADIQTGQLYRDDGVCLTSMILRMLP